MTVRRTLVALAAALSCGAAAAVPAVASEGHVNIVGGSTAPAGAWPSIAYLQGDYHDSSGREQGFGCTGSVVAPQWIVTAAHCTFGEAGESPDDMEATLGVTNLSDPAGEHLAVDRFVPDPSYDPGTLLGDIGLVHLAQPTSRPPMPLATTAGAAAGGYFSPSGVPNAAGWGAVNADGTQLPSGLQQAYLQVRAAAECSSLISGFDPGTQTCAGTAGATSACFGDSGGPLVEIDGASGEPALWGLTSYKPQTTAGVAACSVDVPTVYTWIPAYADFIQATIADPAAAPAAPGATPGDTSAAPAGGSGHPAAQTAACRRARAAIAAARSRERTTLRRLRAARRHRNGAAARRRTKLARRRYHAARARRRKAVAAATRRCHA